jgi:hypothetical protein
MAERVGAVSLPNIVACLVLDMALDLLIAQAGELKHRDML